MSQLIADLKACIEPYKLDKTDLLNRMDDLHVHVSDTEIAIANWFDYGEASLHGDCEELAVKAYAKIKKQFPKLDVEVAWGYEGRFFMELVGWHGFLTVAENGNSSRLIVDPGLKVVQPLNESPYFIEEVEYDDRVKAKLASGRRPLILKGNYATFLGIDHSTNLIYYIGRNMAYHPEEDNDRLVVTTFMYLPKEIEEVMPIDRRTWPISPVPEHIRAQAPLFDLAYRLEMHVRSNGHTKLE